VANRKTQKMTLQGKKKSTTAKKTTRCELRNKQRGVPPRTRRQWVWKGGGDLRRSLGGREATGCEQRSTRIKKFVSPKLPESQGERPQLRTWVKGRSSSEGKGKKRNASVKKGKHGKKRQGGKKKKKRGGDSKLR